MISLLNRFAWCIASILGIVFVLFLIGMWWGYYSFWDEGFIIVFWGLVVGFFIKKVFFSYSQIEESVLGIGWWWIQNNPLAAPVSWISNEVNKDTSVLSEIASHTPESTASLHDSTIVSETQETPIYTTVEPEEPSKIGIWIHNFFSDRPLAKVGGILLFLGALFFLWLIFDAVGNVGRVIIGILFGFFLIGVWVYLDTRNITTESKVLFGVGIAVNYLTILAGRYILDGGMASDPLLSDVFATVALLLNTGLAIALALVYRSRVLLGFAFIFAYMTPFLVGSKTSSVFLLVTYTTILTVAIGIINSFYVRMQESENIEYLQRIGMVGMTLLFSVATFWSSSTEMITIFIWLFVCVIALTLFSYRSKISPLPIFIGAYIVLFIASMGESSFFLLPIGIVWLVLVFVFFAIQWILSLLTIAILGGVSFFLWLFWFWMDGWTSIGILLTIGASVFCLLSILIIRTSSLLLGSIAVMGFGMVALLGVSTHTGVIDIDSILATKAMGIFLLIGASILTLRIRDVFLFFLAILLSGVLMIYPDTFGDSLFFSSLIVVAYWFFSLLIPFFLTRDTKPITHRSFLLGSLPLSALVVTYAIYELGQREFPGLTLGLAYILLAGVYLLYAMVTGSRFFPEWSKETTSTEEGKNILLVLFALPLSLFTLALAFVFGSVPGIMSLSWILESSILYLVYSRMKDTKIYFAWCLVFLIGMMKQVTLLDTITEWEWLMFGILVVMLAAVFSSLYILRDEKSQNRIFYDILHILSIISIGYGISQIIPSTGTGWSILGPVLLLLVLSFFYSAFGNTFHKRFHSILFALVCLSFIGKFDGLKEDIGSRFVQMGALVLILGVGYHGYLSKKAAWYINLTIAILASLILSSLYVKFYFQTFAVSIYLTIIASTVIIRGIVSSSTTLRTVGLYIGTFALLKILGYDIWEWSYGTILRVFALMIAWGLMIYLSQLYGRYVSRPWNEEFSLSSILGSLTRPDTQVWMDIPDIGSSDEIHPFSDELEHELENTSVSHLSGARFMPNSRDSFIVKRVSVLRLALHITTTLKKISFQPDELLSSYDYVLKNLKSSLPEKDLKPLLEKIIAWIRAWGSIEFIDKK